MRKKSPSINEKIVINQVNSGLVESFDPCISKPKTN